MTRPVNFVFILADDLGYADLGCYGGRAPVSPHIDRMAEQGMRFVNGYANSPVCSPTRFALITGRYQYRLRGAADEPLHGPNAALPTHGLPPSHPTLPSLLQAAGYKTALIGKWHLGAAPHFGPQLSGYDEHFGLMSGGVDYFTHTAPNGQKDLWRNGSPAEATGYLTDLLSSEAVGFVERRARDRQPFLLSLHYTAPHWPWETRDDRELAQSLIGRIFHLDGGSVQAYQRMIHHMDEGIGRLLQALDQHGLDQDTVVVFTSDNGGERFSDNWPLVGGKMDLTEGGIRVPYVVRAPGRIPAGAIGHQLIMTMDWAPTFLEAAGVAQHPDYPMDGRSLWPILRQPHAALERDLFWRMKHRGQQAARSGPWKYLAVDGHEYLFNLDADARERANQRHRAPERFDAMKQRYAQWQATMPPIPADAMVTLPYSKADMP
ncbi:sulfatase-like hydrolase/transferase [Ottowia sp.]|uniref:sulfatase-like hydrolase/transferase n=1 Tax=Ottowia sp. TaxID=1898956 RepID=UPI002BD6DBDE|nr:sulfatase-like hydrolase/transferase [Ottowia sp.]HOB66774.1 sulfatase-like hydrolase/transferase [Ottowia sp.]HPZ58574.1 sulfatase-like hydrolase/transferase [Ottowia sp.]HQD48101.1 sulfatase-like hydrolase/transferase [Ottowia sp.]